MSPEPGVAALYDVPTLLRLVDGLYPRLLGQVDRDADSPTFGSCDRHYWMYRLNDFESGVLQQASLAFASLAVLADTADFSTCRYLRREHSGYWRALSAAIARRTAKALERGGMIDEYYPGERSFPATVFGSYATLKSAVLLGDQGIINSPGLEATALEFLTRAPSPAANQDSAAAAFLGLYSRARSWKVDETRSVLDRFLGGERARGVFLEYGGADLGYGTVTLNFLACLRADGAYDTTAAMTSLGSFLATYVTPAGRLGGEFPSRSTTYLLPFGLIEAARLDANIAADLAPLDVEGVFAKLDDRYLTHYCIPSLTQALVSLVRDGVPVHQPAPRRTAWTCDWSPDAGLLAARCGTSALHVGPAKGGTFQVEHDGDMHIDCGYRIEHAGDVYATCVVDDQSKPRVVVGDDGIEITVTARPLRYGKLIASPLKTVILRAISFLGPSFNAMFKKILITRPRALAGVTLQRTIRLEYTTGVLTVSDELASSVAVRVRRAPANSFRLVPSARFYQRGEEEAFLLAGDSAVSFPATSTRQLTPSMSLRP